MLPLGLSHYFNPTNNSLIKNSYYNSWIMFSVSALYSPLPAFPGTEGPTIAWNGWNTAAMDQAAVPFPGQPNGLLGFVLTPAQYQARFGELFVAPELLEPYAGNAAGYPAFQRDLYFLLLQASNIFKAALLLSLDEAATHVVADAAGSTAGATIRHIFVSLTAAYGVPTPSELNRQRLLLATPFTGGLSLPTHLLRHTKTHAFLQRAGAAMSEVDKVYYLTISFSAVHAYSSAIEAFERHFPTAAEQTFALLANAVTLAPPAAHMDTAASSGYVLSLGHSSSATVDTRLATIEAHLAALGAKKDKEPKTKYYCWTHGLSISAAHTSATCRNKRAGHQDQATLANKLGGK